MPAVILPSEQYVIFVTENRSFHEEISIYENPLISDSSKVLVRTASDLKQALENLRTTVRDSQISGLAVGRAAFATQFYSALAPADRRFHGRRLWGNGEQWPEPPFVPIENAHNHETTLRIVKVYLNPSGWDVEVGYDGSVDRKTPPENTLRTISWVTHPRMPVDDLISKLIPVQEEAQPGKTPDADTESMS